MTPADATRTRIADTAEQLFRSMGYQKTAVADIARELGMSPANVYRFFPSKSAINEAITDRLLTGLAARLEAIAAGGGSAESRLMAVTGQLLTSSIGLFFSEKRMHDMVSAAMTEHWGVIKIYIERLAAALAGCVADGVASGEFAAVDPAQAAAIIKNTTLAWHHPGLIAECLKDNKTPEDMAAELTAAMNLLMAGLKRGTR